MKKELDLPKMTIEIENNFICTTYKEDVTIDKEAVKLFLERLYANTHEDISYVQLTDFSKMGNITREARDFVAEKGGGRVFASAIVIRGGIQKTLANMFSLFSKPKVETKFFTDKQAAAKWLNDCLKNY